MRFMIVSDRAPRTYSACARCAKPIVVGYLRELASGVTYCDYACHRGRETTHAPWFLTGFDDFTLVGLQFAKEYQRALIHACTD
jgi:hypothetical protein